MTKITSAIAAAFIASASFASVALADDGDYYAGANEATTIDQTQTGSIGSKDNAQQTPAPVSRGDYYTGANRPN